MHDWMPNQTRILHFFDTVFLLESCHPYAIHKFGPTLSSSSYELEEFVERAKRKGVLGEKEREVFLGLLTTPTPREVAS